MKKKTSVLFCKVISFSDPGRSSSSFVSLYLLHFKWREHTSWSISIGWFTTSDKPRVVENIRHRSCKMTCATEVGRIRLKSIPQIEALLSREDATFFCRFLDWNKTKWACTVIQAVAAIKHGIWQRSTRKVSVFDVRP